MLAREFQNLTVILHDELKYVHVRSPLDLAPNASRYCWTRGSEDFVNSRDGNATTRRPASIRAILVPSNSASRKYAVTQHTVFCSRCCRARNSRCSSARVIGSTAPKGSSIRRIGGS